MANASTTVTAVDPAGTGQQQQQDISITFSSSNPESSSSNNNNGKEPQPRRIVKAAHPKTNNATKDAATPTATAAAVSAATQPKNPQEGGKDKVKGKGNADDKIWERVAASSPGIVAEEQHERNLEERLQYAQQRQRSNREKKLDQHRQKKQEKKDPTSGASTVKANPFSMFLSSFSVEPAHPEHKRRVDDDDDDVKTVQPLGKRLRHSDSSDLEGENRTSALGGPLAKAKTALGQLWTPAATMSVAVAAAAICVGIVLRWGRATGK